MCIVFSEQAMGNKGSKTKKDKEPEQAEYRDEEHQIVEGLRGYGKSKELAAFSLEDALVCYQDKKIIELCGTLKEHKDGAPFIRFRKNNGIYEAYFEYKQPKITL